MLGSDGPPAALVAPATARASAGPPVERLLGEGGLDLAQQVAHPVAQPLDGHGRLLAGDVAPRVVVDEHGAELGVPRGLPHGAHVAAGVERRGDRLVT